MNREVHVRVCEGLRGKFPRPTRLQRPGILEIEKLKPDAVILDMNLSEKIGGIETKRKIESQFDLPV